MLKARELYAVGWVRRDLTPERVALKGHPHRPGRRRSNRRRRSDQNAGYGGHLRPDRGGGRQEEQAAP